MLLRFLPLPMPAFGFLVPLAAAYGGRAGWRAWRCSDRAYLGLETAQRRIFKQNLRWALAAALQPKATQAWFNELEGEALRRYTDVNPLLAFKPMRVYGSTRWNRARRIRVLRDTYRFIESRGGLLRDAVLCPEHPLPILRLPLGALGEAEVVLLGFDERFRKEGEVVAILRLRESGADLAYAAFTFEELSEGTWTCRIGCVQGHQEAETGLHKQVQKALHGLRPKALMVAVAQEFASALGMTEVLGAGNAIQVHRRKHLIHLPWAHELSFDYDALWTEAKGEPGPEGWFRLPLQPVRRGPEEIKPNKRGMYARRYALMDDLRSQVRKALAG